MFEVIYKDSKCFFDVNNVVLMLLEELCEAVAMFEEKEEDIHSSAQTVLSVQTENSSACEIEMQYDDANHEATGVIEIQDNLVIEQNMSTSNVSSSLNASCDISIPGLVINDACNFTCNNLEIEKDDVIMKDPSDNSSDITKLEQSSETTILSGLSQITQGGDDYSRKSSHSYTLINSNSLAHKLVAESRNFKLGNFFKGCKWAPDGLCFLANTNDNFLRIFNTPHECLSNRMEDIEKTVAVEDCLKVKESSLVYDYCWWPLMNSRDPTTCCFASTSANQPVHLWDAFTGSLRASYIALNSVHELTSAHSLCFSNDGRQLLCGYKKDVCLFYTDRPGAHYERWCTMKKKQRRSQNNIISCVEFCPDNSMFACGCYDGTIGIYSPINGSLLDFTAAHQSGITCIKFSKDGNRLYTGVRNAELIKCWDIRNIHAPIFTMKRTIATNQRIYFDVMYDICNETELSLMSGSTDGNVSFWKTKDIVDKTNEITNWNTIELEQEYVFKAHGDCTNGCSFHPYLPLLITSSGQRWFPDVCDSDDEASGVLVRQSNNGENKTKIWYLYAEEAYSG